MMTSIAGGLNMGIWLCAVVLGCYRERHHRNGGGIAAVRRREVHR